MRRTWLSRRAVALHLTLVVTVPTFLALCWWQVNRALSGNELSWAYVFEWPFFAGYAVWMWWKILHSADDDVPARHLAVPVTAAEEEGAGCGPGLPTPTPPSGPPGALASPGAVIAVTATDEDTTSRRAGGDSPGAGSLADPADAELAAYNAYLAELAARGPAKRW